MGKLEAIVLYVCAYVLSHVWLLVTPWTVAPRLLCPWQFSGKNTRSGLLFPTPGDLPDLGSKLHALCLLHWQVDLFTTAPAVKPVKLLFSHSDVDYSSPGSAVPDFLADSWSRSPFPFSKFRNEQTVSINSKIADIYWLFISLEHAVLNALYGYQGRS